MTIQFNYAWNGYSGIQTLDTAEEARLVGLGIARYYTPYMDGGPSNPEANNLELDPTAGLLLGGAAPNEQQRTAVRAGIGIVQTLTTGTTVGPSAWTNHTRSFGHHVTKSGTIRSVSVNLSAAGTGELHHYEKTEAGYVFKQSWPFATSVNGANVLSFDAFAVAEGDFISYATKTGGYIRYTADVAADIGFYITPTPVTIGAVVALAAATRPCLEFTLEYDRLELAEVAVSAFEGRFPEEYPVSRESKALVNTTFPGASVPTDWTASGAWVVDNGISPPATGGWDCYAVSPGDASSAKRRMMARIRVDSASSSFGICSKPTENSGGAIAMVVGSSGKLRLYSWDGTSTPGAYVNEVALPGTLVVGRYYVLEVEKSGLVCTIRFTDTVTQQSCSVSEEQLSGYRQWHGRAGLHFLSGAVKFDWFEVDALYPEQLRAIVIGDSNSEGNYLPIGTPSWAFRLSAARSNEGDILVAARAGDETPNFIARKVHDLLPWKPKYVVLALGTNDTDQAVWRTNIAATIVEILAIGAEPILCTQVPSAASQALRTAMNVDIRAGYFGRYRYIDHAVAVSLNNDGVTWSTLYDQGDGTHANYLGQEKLFVQTVSDAPFLLS